MTENGGVVEVYALRERSWITTYCSNNDLEMGLTWTIQWVDWRRCEDGAPVQRNQSSLPLLGTKMRSVSQSPFHEHDNQKLMGKHTSIRTFHSIGTSIV